MRSFLAQQMEEKEKREKDEKSNIDMQAKMWETDADNWKEEEKRLKDRITRINRDNQAYLMKQMMEKEGQEKANRGYMHNQDFLMNKPLLREINSKLKASTYAASEGARS